jgi:hypothetical protein
VDRNAKVQEREQGKAVTLLGGPAYFLPRALLPNFSCEPGVQWVRPVFLNGRHRMISSEFIGQHEPWRISEGLRRFDEWTRVGCLIAVVDFDMRVAQAKTPELTKAPVLAVARLASVVDGDLFEDQAFLTQRWVNLVFPEHRNG